MLDDPWLAIPYLRRASGDGPTTGKPSRTRAATPRGTPASTVRLNDRATLADRIRLVRLQSSPRPTLNVSVTLPLSQNGHGKNCFTSIGENYGTSAFSTPCLRAHDLRLSGEFVLADGRSRALPKVPVQAYRRRRERQSRVPWLSPQIVSVQLSPLQSRIPGIQAIHSVPDELHHAIHAHGLQPVLATQ